MDGRRYLRLASQYESAVLSGRVPACKWVKLAVQRNRRDLKRQGSRRFPFTVNAAAVGRVCGAIERMPHIKGPLARPVLGLDGELHYRTITLEPWQAWYVSTLFGWVDARTGLRRFRQAFLSVPRKNAKSTLAAAIMDYMLAADDEPGAEVYAGATKRDQARIVWSLARAMAKKSPGFLEQFGVDPQKHRLIVERSDSTCEPLAAEADNLDGLNTHFAVLDELHAHRTRDLYDVIETSMGARLQPLLLLITTAGVSTAGICYEVLTYLRRILEGSVTDESFFGVEYTIDEGDERRWWDVAIQRKANPNFGVSVMPDDLARLALKAQHSAAAVNNFLTKRLNVWVRAEGASGLSETAWARCKATWDDAAVKGRPCWIGVDMSQSHDMAAIVVVWDLGPRDLRVWVRCYLPAATIAASGTSALAGWVRDGHLVEVEGQAIDFAALEADLNALIAEWAPSEVCFDRALATYLLQNLEARWVDDPKIVVVPQDRKTIAPAWGEFKRLVLAGEIRHTGNPVLAWMVGNCAVRRFDDGEEYPVKAGGKDSPNYIDGVRALCNVLARRLSGEASGPSDAYAEGGIAWVE